MTWLTRLIAAWKYRDMRVTYAEYLKMLESTELETPDLRPPDKFRQIAWYKGRRVFITDMP
jgi:hypothetical protein